MQILETARDTPWHTVVVVLLVLQIVYKVRRPSTNSHTHRRHCLYKVHWGGISFCNNRRGTLRRRDERDKRLERWEKDERGEYVRYDDFATLDIEEEKRVLSSPSGLRLRLELFNLTITRSLRQERNYCPHSTRRIRLSRCIYTAMYCHILLGKWCGDAILLTHRMERLCRRRPVIDGWHFPHSSFREPLL